MRNISGIILLILLNQLTDLKSQEIKPDITKFFKVVYGENKEYVFIEPDSLKNDSKYSDFASNTYLMNSYLYDNYSMESKKTKLLDSLLTDTVKLRMVHNELLLNDTNFKEIFYKCYFKDSIEPIHIDSLQIIMSRFFYLHRLKNGNIAMHLCSVKNEAKQLRQDNNTLYYNAFCYMVLRDQDCFTKLKNGIISELDERTDDKKIIELKNKNYQILSKHPTLRQLLIDEYLLKKKYLNFRLIY